MAKKNPGRGRTWVPSPPAKATVPDALKKLVQTKANELVERVLKPKYLKPPPKKRDWNYPIDIWTKWQGRFFYFGSTWASPGPNRIAPTFEHRFARLEFVGDRRCDLAYFRHTGKWWTIHTGLTLDECLELVGGGGPFTLM